MPLPALPLSQLVTHPGSRAKLCPFFSTPFVYNMGAAGLEPATRIHRARLHPHVPCSCPPQGFHSQSPGNSVFEDHRRLLGFDVADDHGMRKIIQHLIKRRLIAIKRQQDLLLPCHFSLLLRHNYASILRSPGIIAGATGTVSAPFSHCKYLIRFG